MTDQHTNSNPDFARLLRNHVRSAGFTFKQLAQAANLPDDTVENWLDGKVKRPRRWRDVLMVAGALDLSNTDADRLLKAAGHQPLATFLRIYRADGELAPWREAASDAATLPPAAPIFVGVPLLPPFLVGRERELAELRHALGVDVTSGDAQIRVALSAAHGMGGVGKTALATAIAYDEQVLRRYWDGVLWAGIGFCPKPDDILSLWASGLGIDVSSWPTLERVSRIQASIGGRPFLIILDDVWQIEVAQMLANVAGVNCGLLLTTRDQVIARTFAPQTHEYVRELGEDEAVQLLSQLCPEAAAVDAAAVRRLAQAVGGLPLALKLVGGYLSSHITFAEEAAEAFRALSCAADWLGLRDATQQLTIEEVILKSVAALPDERSRAAFTALSAFAPKPADFTLDAATHVAAVDAGVIGLLVRRNLVEQSGEERITIHQAIAAVATRLAEARDDE